MIFCSVVSRNQTQRPTPSRIHWAWIKLYYDGSQRLMRVLLVARFSQNCQGERSNGDHPLICCVRSAKTSHFWWITKFLERKFTTCAKVSPRAASLNASLLPVAERRYGAPGQGIFVHFSFRSFWAQAPLSRMARHSATYSKSSQNFSLSLGWKCCARYVLSWCRACFPISSFVWSSQVSIVSISEL